ncbi:MAG: hypothetical protein ACTHWW_10905 [Arthrobacter sp.]|uniref:hypothetical protein n=1 Tax=unclassified Arthrobacter TaxID=235627 RepID=UPI0026510009|nr:hypothetical protein [Micrococcaceae bacterium]MDN5812131.1 hypothetical protein [Micrococcaceae bacterium]MDN5823216.1 hypothetical protein [Micrococcaceae bacterium]MDN5877979.1 hypothetical protein [Micrococcaceae bacterium]MDN5885508.1 hypothetical protein [Micrococcaceae bacterium]
MTGKDTIYFSGTDPVAQAALRAPLPDLGEIGTQQPFSYDGAWVHSGAVELLMKMVGGYRPGRLQQRLQRSQLEELREAELVSGNELTSGGQLLVAVMNEAEASFRLSGLIENHEYLFQCWASEQMALIITQPGYHAAGNPEFVEQPTPAHVNIRVVPLLDLSTLMAKWVGLAPAWNFDLLPVEIPMTAIEDQMNGSSAVPDDANDVLQDAWREKWMLWSLEGSCPAGDLDPLTYLTAGRRGQHRLAQQESESVMLIPTGSTYVFDQIEDRLQAMVFQRDPVLP